MKNKLVVFCLCIGLMLCATLSFADLPTPSPTPVQPTPTDSPASTPTPEPKFISGWVTDVSSSSWKTVTLYHNYVSMVVIGTANYTEAESPAVVRIRNAQGNSFEVKMGMASNGSISGVTVYYIVGEEGAYSEPKMEFRKIVSDQTNARNRWNEGRMERLHYINSYSSRPAVLGQVMTYNDPDWSSFWACDGRTRKYSPSATACYVGKHVGEDSDRSRADETIGVFVIESGFGGIGRANYIAGVGPDIVEGMGDNPPYEYNLSGPEREQVAIVSTSGMDDPDGGWPVLYGPDPVVSARLPLAINEDTLKDAERSHDKESVAYFIVE